jgi:hypothetical protein
VFWKKRLRKHEKSLPLSHRARRAFFFKLNGENISGDGIILSDMEFGIHTLSALVLSLENLTLADARLHFLCVFGFRRFSLGGTFM